MEGVVYVIAIEFIGSYRVAGRQPSAAETPDGQSNALDTVDDLPTLLYS